MGPPKPRHLVATCCYHIMAIGTETSRRSVASRPETGDQPPLVQQPNIVPADSCDASKLGIEPDVRMCTGARNYRRFRRFQIPNPQLSTFHSEQQRAGNELRLMHERTEVKFFDKLP